MSLCVCASAVLAQTSSAAGSLKNAALAGDPSLTTAAASGRAAPMTTPWEVRSRPSTSKQARGSAHSTSASVLTLASVETTSSVATAESSAKAGANDTLYSNDSLYSGGSYTVPADVRPTVLLNHKGVLLIWDQNANTFSLFLDGEPVEDMAFVGIDDHWRLKFEGAYSQSGPGITGTVDLLSAWSWAYPNANGPAMMSQLYGEWTVVIELFDSKAEKFDVYSDGDTIDVYAQGVCDCSDRNTFCRLSECQARSSCGPGGDSICDYFSN
jgi:hypothetical protein